MDKYMKLQCVKGLLMSLEEQLGMRFQKDGLTENEKRIITEKYYDAIQEQLDEPEKAKEDIDLKKDNVQEILEETNQIDDSQVKKIMINGIRKPILSDQLTYSELLDLAFEKPNLSTEYTITYSYKDKFDRSGSIILGDDPITIKDDMVFNITDTSKA